MNKDQGYLLRVSEEEIAIVEALRKKLGLRSNADVWRQALRALAETHKVKAKPARTP